MGTGQFIFQIWTFMVLLSIYNWPVLSHPVLYKGIEPFFSARKAGVLTVRRIEHKTYWLGIEPKQQEYSSCMLPLHYQWYVEVVGFEPTQQWSNRFTVCPDSPTSAYFRILRMDISPFLLILFFKKKRPVCIECLAKDRLRSTAFFFY